MALSLTLSPPPPVHPLSLLSSTSPAFPDLTSHHSTRTCPATTASSSGANVKGLLIQHTLSCLGFSWLGLGLAPACLDFSLIHFPTKPYSYLTILLLTGHTYIHTLSSNFLLPDSSSSPFLLPQTNKKLSPFDPNSSSTAAHSRISTRLHSTLQIVTSRLPPQPLALLPHDHKHLADVTRE